ncbi:MAG: periplasmic heavy metal sensor [Candidatus Erginobacter occultus]|nr:periplasmic heavy metal sensor [Candidatus Erginobacter occultus]
MRIWIGLLAAPLVMGLAHTAGAREGSPRGREGRDFWRSERVVEKLALTPEQVEKLETTGADFQAQNRELSARWQAGREELQAAMSAEEFSTGEVDRLGEVLAGLAAERSRLNTARMIAIRQILTAEQWDELQTGRQRMGERMKRKMRGGPRGEAARRGWPVEPEAVE